MTAQLFSDQVLRLAALADVPDPTSAQLDQLARYYALLERWNARVNLTALPLAGFPDATVNRLIIEPLVAAVLVPTGGLVCVDLGSGGGSPAIPLKIVRPALHLVMVESRARKAAFLREAAREAGLLAAEVLTERIEVACRDRAGQADLVTIRGVRPDSSLLLAIRDLLKPTGRLVLFGSQQDVVGFRVLSEHLLPGGRSTARELQAT